MGICFSCEESSNEFYNNLYCWDNNGNKIQYITLRTSIYEYREKTFAYVILD